MYYPKFREFKKKALAGSIVPVYKEILADMETPVSVFCKINDGKYSFLLESVEGGERLGRYSFIGSNPLAIFQVKDKVGTIYQDGKINKLGVLKDPLAYLKNLLHFYSFVKDEDLPDFSGGAVGYIGYDYIRCLEDIPDSNPDDLNVPDLFFLVVNEVVIFDYLKHVIKVVSNAHINNDPQESYQKAVFKIEEIIKKINQPLNKHLDILYHKEKRLKVESNCTKEEFIHLVKQAKKYILEGDIFQVVLSQRLSFGTQLDPLNVYRILRRINPSPYMFYLHLDKMSLIGSSPELLVKFSNQTVETRPIAGTVPRGTNAAQDKLLEKELIGNPKERAEHLMLIDLGRNDLGKVCNYKSIELPEFMVVEKYSHVMHLVTSVKGQICPKYDQFDAIKACFPAGTVTGAPKIRAMEIIEELEKTKRGPYAGCICYFSFSNYFDSCITIRTILMKDGQAYIQAGAGIVADSNPEAEYIETINKAKALIEVFKIK
ncbi:anthranilate synthase component I [bacterium]|nr:anthranilate synthase component I [bacterium]MBU1152611.1 anthranilate synthase component I [bacterium]MBU2600303.1 anthranilate synthase component I [bacterium]